jgi:dTDP-3-amino-3,4,6-trideoxy-alpha-D-glucose transaminase
MSERTLSATGLVEQAERLREELEAAFARVLRSGWYILGSEVGEFEAEFAAWLGLPHAVAVASGTDALRLALQALEVGPGDEVIVPSNALPTSFGVAATGCRIRFCDARQEDYNLDPADVAGLLSPRTRAIVAVHLYGHPADVPALRALADQHGLALVEDCAQAHGARWEGRPAGTFGDVAAFSFYPTKNLGALGDAGLVATRDAALAARVRRLRTYGEERRFFSTEIGINSRMDELQAAFLRVKLRHLDANVRRRREAARLYDQLLAPLVAIPPARDGTDHARHLYPVAVDGRDRVLDVLRQAGIPAGVHYPLGAHDQPCFAHFRERDLPCTERLAGRLVSLPMHTELLPEDIARVADTLTGCVSPEGAQAGRAS